MAAQEIPLGESLARVRPPQVKRGAIPLLPLFLVRPGIFKRQQVLCVMRSCSTFFSPNSWAIVGEDLQKIKQRTVAFVFPWLGLSISASLPLPRQIVFKSANLISFAHPPQGVASFRSFANYGHATGHFLKKSCVSRPCGNISLGYSHVKACWSL